METYHRPTPNTYLCLKYNPKKVQKFTEYEKVSLSALGVDYCNYKPVVVNGSVLVYVRCPSYIPWYIEQCKEEIFNKLAENGLTEIYECFISDVETSIQRPDNQQFREDLLMLKEEMIKDGISKEPTSNR